MNIKDNEIGGPPAAAGDSLADRFPQLAAALHPTLNPAGTDPAKIAWNSPDRLRWTCSAPGRADHVWLQSVRSRARAAEKGRLDGCPFCAASTRIVVGSD